MGKKAKSPKAKRYPPQLGELRASLAGAIPYLIMIAILWGAFMICGIFVARAAGEEFVKACPYLALRVGEYAPFKTFIWYVAIYFGMAAVCYTGTFHGSFALIGAALCAYWGYRFGVSAVGCCNADLMGGVVSILLYYLPLNLTALALAWFSCALQMPYRLRGKALQTCPAILRRSCVRSLCLFGGCAVVALLVTVLIPLGTRVIFF